MICNDRATKNLCHTSQILIVKGIEEWGEGSSESIRKRKLMTKIFFKENVEGSSKNFSNIISIEKLM